MPLALRRRCSQLENAASNPAVALIVESIAKLNPHIDPTLAQRVRARLCSGIQSSHLR
jgi:hypothetical protein